MSDFPRMKTVDDTLALPADGYTYIGKQCEKPGTDVFQTRMMLLRGLQLALA